MSSFNWSSINQEVDTIFNTIKEDNKTHCDDVKKIIQEKYSSMLTDEIVSDFKVRCKEHITNNPFNNHTMQDWKNAPFIYNIDIWNTGEMFPQCSLTEVASVVCHTIDANKRLSTNITLSYEVINNDNKIMWNLKYQF